MFSAVRRNWHQGRYRKIKELIQNPGTLLDIGCGAPFTGMPDGSFIQFMGTGIGLDIKQCSGTFPRVRGDSTQLPFKNNSFDTVVAMELLEHLSKPKLALKEIQRVLKPSGLFVASTPNNTITWKTVWFIWERTVGREWRGEHLVDYHNDHWLNLFEQEFTLEKTITYRKLNLIATMRKKP